MKIAIIVGTRPNFMKAAPIIWAAKEANIETVLIHTGQHYDENMSEVFIRELGLPKPQYNLGVGSGTHGQITANCMLALEKVLLEVYPHLVLVVGDVDSTLAGAITTAKMRIPLGHVEAGLRSFDRSMPEEINRMATDAISNLHFISEPGGLDNLHMEGHRDKNLFFVGNVMIDTLKHFLPTAIKQDEKLLLPKKSYALVTLHRPSNVDNFDDLKNCIQLINEVQKNIPVLFPIHPRTRQKLDKFYALNELHVMISEPLGYLDFLTTMNYAKVVITDSGGIQEETTALGIPCLTMRDNTERPITVERGTNTLVGSDGRYLIEELEKVLAGTYKIGRQPDLWDGHAAKRIIDIIKGQ